MNWEYLFLLHIPHIFYMIDLIQFMKRKFNQWWSTIPPISTKWATISHLKPPNKQKHDIYSMGKSMALLGIGTKMWLLIKYSHILTDIYLHSLLSWPHMLTYMVNGVLACSCHKYNWNITYLTLLLNTNQSR